MAETPTPTILTLKLSRVGRKGLCSFPMPLGSNRLKSCFIEQKKKILLYFCFIIYFGNTLSSAQGLLLTEAGITPGCALGDPGRCHLWLAVCKANVLDTATSLSLASSRTHLCPFQVPLQ